MAAKGGADKAKAEKERIRQEKLEEERQKLLKNLVIGEPMAFKQEGHVETDPSAATGLKGLPKEWEAFLLSSGVSKQEILKNPEAVLRILNENKNTLFGNKEESKVTLDGKKIEKPANPLPSQKQVADTMSWDKIITQNVDVDKIYPERKKIGEGSSGSVYVTSNKDAKNNNGFIALKVMNILQGGEQTGISNDLTAIMNEVGIMKLCQACEQIVHFYDAFTVKETERSKQEGKQLWIAMEYVGGGCLTNILSVSGSVPDPLTAYVMKEMLLALAFLHKNHRLHRDIKSDNVLIGIDGALKLSDFGFCAQLTQEVKKRKSIVGTPYWMSPELIQGLEYDELTDIWSLGITAIECADGEPPLLSVPPFRALFLIATSPPPTLKNPGAHSPLLSKFLQCCLQHDVTKRWTAEKLLTHPFIGLACKKDELVPYVRKSREKLKPQDGLKV